MMRVLTTTDTACTYNGPNVGSATEKARIVRRLWKANMDKANFKEWCIKAKRDEDNGSGDSSNDDDGRSGIDNNDDLDDDADDEPPISGSSSDDGKDNDGSH